MLEATSDALVGIAVRQHDDELVAAEAPQHVGGLDPGTQPLGKLDQQGVAGGVSERIVDILEVIEIEKDQRELLALGAILDGLFDQLTKLRAVRQAGQHVVIGEPGDLRPRLLAFDRQRAEVNAGVDDPLMPVARRAAFPEIEGESPDHAAILGLDRRGPAGSQPGGHRHGLERLPARIGVDILARTGLP